MNLRLSRDSIRVRVEFDEALELLDKGFLIESLPLADRILELRIETANAGTLRFDEFASSSCMKLLVPRADLKQLIVNHENRSSKSGLELKVIAVLGNCDIDVRFEIDRFKPKPKEMNL